MDTRRIVVISDTHKDFFTLRKIVERHRQDTDLFLHLGDVEEVSQPTDTQCTWKL